MSAPVFYHISIAHSRGELIRGAIQARLDKFQDWFMYGHGETWIVCCDQPCGADIASELVPIVRGHGSCVICRIDVNDVEGLAPAELWTWLRKSRAEVPEKKA